MDPLQPSQPEFTLQPQPPSYYPPRPPANPGGVADKLRALAIAHYVIGGFICVFGLFPLIHVAVGAGMLLMALGGGAAAAGSSSPGSAVVAAPFGFMGFFFLLIGGMMVLLFQTAGFCTIYSGMNLWKQNRYTFSIVMAGVLCIFFPFGTVVGVLTLVCLCSPEGRAAYGQY